MTEDFRIAADEANRKLIGNLKKLSLNMLATWRNMRESLDYAKRYKLRPRLTGNYNQEV